LKWTAFVLCDLVQDDSAEEEEATRTDQLVVQ